MKLGRQNSTTLTTMRRVAHCIQPAPITGNDTDDMVVACSLQA